MLSRELVRQKFEEVRDLLAARGVDSETVEAWRRLDEERRVLLVQVEEFNSQRNEASKAIGKIKQQGGDADAQIAKVSELKAEIEVLETKLQTTDRDLNALEVRLPNLPDPEVPVGKSEAENRLEREVGTPREFTFEPKPHWDLGVDLGILDFERAAKLTGARFAVYLGAGAAMERALIAMMLDMHCANGYTEVIPPFMVNADSLFGTGQLPKFADDLFRIEGQPYFLIPTAEVPLTNLHRGELLSESDLPIRYASITPCFRAEAGSYGRDVRGLIRMHQFHKVEMVHFTTAEDSVAALELMTGHAEAILQRLDLPYRVVTLSTGDMGFAAARTYDLEVWLPTQGYREISSCSNCRDFQARRAEIRYRPEGGGKAQLVHTLNGSGLAVGRTMIAVLENYQQEDGSVLIPPALQPYMGGLEKIEVPD